MAGKLIVIQGLDGSGKETQTKLLCEALSSRKIAFQKISFPDYGSPSSSLVKMYLNGDFGNRPGDVNAYAASSFYAVDRFASYRRCWKKAYDRGDLIIADRYTTSNLVFQLPKVQKEKWGEFLKWLEDYEYEKLGLPKPDLTFYLEMPEKVSEQLLNERYHGDESQKDIHEKDCSFQHACRESAAFAAQALKWQIIYCVENGRLRTPEEIHREMTQKIDKEFSAYAII